MHIFEQSDRVVKSARSDPQVRLSEEIDPQKFFGVQVFSGAFEPSECGVLWKLGAGSNEYQGLVSAPQLRRNSLVRWIERTDDTDWIYNRLWKIFEVANRRLKFALTGFREPLQLSTYPLGGCLGPHTDVGEGAGQLRKITVSVQLSPPSDYEGGQLLFPTIEGGRAPVALGTAIVFPSFLAHEVSVVQRGERRSISAWASGPPFS